MREGRETRYILIRVTHIRGKYLRGVTGVDGMVSGARRTSLWPGWMIGGGGGRDSWGDSLPTAVITSPLTSATHHCWRFRLSGETKVVLSSIRISVLAGKCAWIAGPASLAFANTLNAPVIM